MAEQTIVPPTPEVTQGESVSDPGFSIQAAFDRALPDKGTRKAAPTPPPAAAEPPKAPAPPPTEEKKTTTEPAKSVEPAKPTPDAAKIPSFIEDVLDPSTQKPQRSTESTQATAPTSDDGDWPEEMPTFKTSEEAKDRYKKWNSSYQKLKFERDQLKARPAGMDEVTAARFTQLEKDNKEMSGVLARVSVEKHQDFQNNVLRPLQGAWNEATRIVKDSGGDPNDLSRVVTLRGKAQFEELDKLMTDWPESAKAELHESLRQYRRFDGARREAIANAPKTMEMLRQKDMAEQMKVLDGQRAEMSQTFSNAMKRLRDELKVEVLMKGTGDDEATKAWNENADHIENNAKKLLFENTDMERMAMATALACSADSFRKLWLGAEARARKAEAINAEKFGGEPNLSERGGPSSSTPEAKFKDDLKRPLKDVFLETLKGIQGK